MTEANERVRPAVLDLCMGVESLDKASADFDSLTVQEAVEHLSVVKEVLTRMRQLDATLERWVAECFKAEGWRDPQEFPGVGVVEVRRSKTRRAWDHTALRSDWLNRYLEEHDGEVPGPFEFIEDFLSVASVGSYKVTGLRSAGLDPSDYCDETPGTPTVSIVRSETPTQQRRSGEVDQHPTTADVLADGGSPSDPPPVAAPPREGVGHAMTVAVANSRTDGGAS